MTENLTAIVSFLGSITVPVGLLIAIYIMKRSTPASANSSPSRSPIGEVLDVILGPVPSNAQSSSPSVSFVPAPGFNPMTEQEKKEFYEKMRKANAGSPSDAEIQEQFEGMERVSLEFYSNRYYRRLEVVRERDIMNLESQLRAALSKEIYSVMAGVNRLFDDVQGHNRRVEMVKNMIHPRWLAEDEKFFDSCYRQAFYKHLKRSAKREGKQLPAVFRMSGNQQTVRKAVANLPTRR